SSETLANAPHYRPDARVEDMKEPAVGGGPVHHQMRALMGAGGPAQLVLVEAGAHVVLVHAPALEEGPRDGEAEGAARRDLAERGVEVGAEGVDPAGVA